APVVVMSPSTAWPLPSRLTRYICRFLCLEKLRNLTGASGPVALALTKETFPTPHRKDSAAQSRPDRLSDEPAAGTAQMMAGSLTPLAKHLEYHNMISRRP